MALSIEEIKKLITSSIPDATIEIKDLVGDSNHYSAKIDNCSRHSSELSWENKGDTNNIKNKFLKRLIQFIEFNSN